MAYYLSKYVGTYRVKSPVDLTTNDFARTEDGKLEQNDTYIKCKKGEIYHFGRNILVCYCDKLGAGRNVLKALGKKLGVDIENYTITKEKKDGTLYLDQDGNPMKFYDYDNYYKALENSKIIWDIIETDEEVLWKFKDKDILIMAEFMIPQTSGADISPFSTRNLPKSKYEIPNEDLEEYKKITDKFEKGNTLIIGHLTKQFISNIPKNFKEFRGKDIKAMQKKEALKAKEFIHKIKLWNEYIKFLKENIK